MVRAMVHSTKHFLQVSISTLTAGTATVIDVCEAVAVVDKNIPSEIEEGATIKAVYVELWSKTNAGASGSTIYTIEKIVGGGADPNTTTLASLSSYNNKKNVLKTHQGLTNDNASIAMPIFREWIAIPKGKQRFGLGDKIVIGIFAQTGTLQFCGINIFKEYT